MKKILCLIAIFFICSITLNVKAAGTVVFNIDANGNLTANAESNGRYTYEDGVLTLTNVDNDSFVINSVLKETTLHATNDVHLISITVNTVLNVEINNDSVLDVVAGPGIVNFNNSNVNGGILANNTANINNSTVNNISTVNAKLNVKDSTINGNEIRINNSGINSFDNAKVNYNVFYLAGNSSSIKDSDFRVANEINVSGNTFTIDDSYIFFGDYFQLPTGDTTITNSELKSGDEGTRKQLHLSGHLTLKDTKITAGDVLLSGNGTDMDGVELYSKNGYTFFPTTIKNSKVTIEEGSTITLHEVENSEINIGSDHQLWLYGSIKDSKIHLSSSTPIDFRSDEVTNSYIDIDTTWYVTGSIDKLDKSFINIIGTNTPWVSVLDFQEFKDSLFIVKNDPTIEAYFTGHDLLGENNLVAYAEDGSLLDLEEDDDPNAGTWYRFYKDGEISNYVEIRSRMNVTAKVVNGTWEDGTSEDKILNTYAGVKLSDLAPTGMKADAGYKNGTWNVEINENRVFNTIELVYTFVKDDSAVVEETTEEENLVNPKTSDNVEKSILTLMISFIGLIIISKKYKFSK